MTPIRTRLATAPVLGLALVLLVASVIGVVQQRTGGDATATPAGPGKVAIAGFAFAPEALQAKVGQSITWTNSDKTAHTVTSASGTTLTSGAIDPGRSFTTTFSTPGTYAYYCSFHPFMKGTVEVTR